MSLASIGKSIWSGIKGAGKGIGRLAKNGVKSLGKGIWNGAKSFGNSVLESTKPREGGVNLNVDSVINPVTEGIKTIRDAAITGTPKDPMPDFTRRKRTPNAEESMAEASTPTVVSYKKLPNVNLHSDDPKAVEEFMRHNKEVERLMKEDIDTDEKLGRDKFGRDILEYEQAESHRKEVERQLAEEAKRRKEAEEAAEEERRRLAQEEADRRAAEKSRGSTENENSNQESNGNSGEGDSGGGSGLLGGLGGLLTSLLGPGILSLIKSPLKGLGWLGKTIWKGLKLGGSKAWAGTKWLGRGLANVASKVGKGISSAVKGVTKFLKSPLSSLKSLGGSIAKGINKGFSKIGNFLSPIVNPIKNLGSKVVKGISSGLSNLTKGPLSSIKNLSSNIAKGISKGFSKIGNFLSPIVNPIKNLGSKVVSGISKGLTGLTKGPLSSIKNLSSNIAKGVAKGFSKLGGFLSPIVNPIKNLGSKVVSGISKGLAGLNKGPLSSIKNLSSNIAKGINKGFSKLGGFLSPIVNPIKNLGSKVVKGISSGLTNLTKGPLSSLKSLGGSIAKGINKGFSKAVSGLNNITKGVSNTVKKLTSGMKSLPSKISSGVKGLTKKLSSGISGLSKSLKSTLSGLASKISGGISKIGTGFKSLGKNLTNKLKNTVSPVIKAVKSPLSKVAEFTKDKLINPALGLAKNVGKKLLSSRAAKAVKFLANPKALGKLGKKMLSKIMPSIPKLTAKLGMTMAKAGGKSALKQVPLLGAALGIGEAISDIMKGDYVGAGLSALAGIAPTLNLVAPGVGTAISMGAIGADIARDVLKGPVDDAVKVFDESDPATIENEPEVDLSQGIQLEDNPNSTKANEVDKMSKASEVAQIETKRKDIGVDKLKNDKFDESFGSDDIFKRQSAEPYNPDDNTSTTANFGLGNLPWATGNYTPMDMKVTGDLSQRMLTAMKFFTNPNGLNLTPNQAAGLVGVLSAESRLNPHVVNTAERDGTATAKGIKHLPVGYGAGIAQWTNPDPKSTRKNRVLNHINRTFGKNYGRIEDSNLDEQLEAVKFELENERPKTLAMLRNARSINDATDIMLRGYENGGNGKLASKEFIDRYTWAGGYQGSMYSPKNGRVNFANSAYKHFLNEGQGDGTQFLSDGGSSVRSSSTGGISPYIAAPKSYSPNYSFGSLSHNQWNQQGQYNRNKSKNVSSSTRNSSKKSGGSSTSKSNSNSKVTVTSKGKSSNGSKTKKGSNSPKVSANSNRSVSSNSVVTNPIWGTQGNGFGTISMVPNPNSPGEYIPQFVAPKSKVSAKSSSVRAKGKVTPGLGNGNLVATANGSGTTGFKMSKIEPPVAESTGNNNVNKSKVNKGNQSNTGDQKLVAVNGGNTVVGPTINGGEQRVINITNVTTNDPLNAELFG